MEIKVRHEAGEPAVVWIVGDDGETRETSYIAEGSEASITIGDNGVPAPIVTAEIGGEPLNPLERDEGGQAADEDGQSAAAAPDAAPGDEEQEAAGGAPEDTGSGSGISPPVP